MKTNRSSFQTLCAEWLLLVIGCMIYAVSTVWIQEVNVIPGSMLGIAVAVHKLTGFPSGTMNLLLNIPIMVVVTRKMGAKTLFYTIFILACSGILIDWWSGTLPMLPCHNAYVLALVGGVTMGIGAGLLILAKGTMAGTTALALLLSHAIRKPSYGTVLFLMDSCIVLLGCTILGDWNAILCSVLYALSCAKVIDAVLFIAKTLHRKPDNPSNQSES